MVIGHLGYGGQVTAEFVENRRRLFYRCSCGHVDDDLELGFVVERQHLELHEADRRQQERDDDHRRDAQSKQAAVALAAGVVEQRPENAIEHWGEPAGEAMRFLTL